MQPAGVACFWVQLADFYALRVAPGAVAVAGAVRAPFPSPAAGGGQLVGQPPLTKPQGWGMRQDSLSWPVFVQRLQPEIWTSVA